MKENHRSIWDTMQVVVSKYGKRHLPVWSYKLWVEVNMWPDASWLLSAFLRGIRQKCCLRNTYIQAQSQNLRGWFLNTTYLKGCGTCDLVIPYVWSILFTLKSVLKEEHYLKDLWRSEMTANSHGVEFSDLAMFSLYLGGVLMGQELLSGQLAKAARLCAALLAVVLWGQGRCPIYIAWSEIMSLKQP